MATAVYALAAKTPGKESMAMEAFARALLQLPVVIADNAGYDSAQLVSELRAAHSQGKHTIGLSKISSSLMMKIHLKIAPCFFLHAHVLFHY